MCCPTASYFPHRAPTTFRKDFALASRLAERWLACRAQGRAPSASAFAPQGCQLAARSDFAPTLAARLSVKDVLVGSVFLRLHALTFSPPPARLRSRSS